MIRIVTISILFFAGLSIGYSQQHPRLIITKESIQQLQMGANKYELFKNSYASAKAEVDEAMRLPISVPTPKDLAGGFTHEQHKSNFLILQKAGVVFQISKEEKYAQWIKDVLFKYAELYPTFDRHPDKRSYSPGKFFWQCLNDANWLVYVSQAYDCIYDWLPKNDRENLNKNLFRPLADFLSIETPQFFNRIHNHSTWGNAAVGMIGLVMSDEELIKRALYGIPDELVKIGGKDNDGATIYQEGAKGFLAQIDHSFSPDGYYTEGPYYQRYAMYPFLLFAQALANTRPKQEIFKYKNGVLIKAVYALLNQTDSNGEFFPINDAAKGMSYLSRELISAVGVAYYFGTKDPSLLSIAKLQQRVSLDVAGLSVAEGISKGMEKPFIKKSIQLSDGANGDEGAIGILRSREPNQDLTLVMKYSKHGMGHGHFDKLSFSMYNNGKEVFQDYGAARWVNIEQKDGGGYLKENNSWAKQSIAHNTVVVNGQTQFKGSVQVADTFHGIPYLFETNTKGYQIMSASETNGYEGIKMQRTLVLIEGNHSIVLDLFKINSEKKNTYDFPLYFKGDVMKTSFAYQVSKELVPMGTNNGYQHLWKEASGVVSDDKLSFSWFDRGNFQTISGAVQAGDSVLFARVGANDPSFNLRREPVFLIRRTNADNTLFANVYEIHGNYTPVEEIATDAYSSIRKVSIVHDSMNYSVVRIEHVNNQVDYFAMANDNSETSAKHAVEIAGEKLEWTGAYKLFNRTEK